MRIIENNTVGTLEVNQDDSGSNNVHIVSKMGKKTMGHVFVCYDAIDELIEVLQAAKQMIL